MTKNTSINKRVERDDQAGTPSERPRIVENTIIFPASIDPDAVKIIKRLKRYGHKAYLVGGCVRDLLLGAIPKDFDVATSARPRQIRRLFRNSKIIGRRFKLAHVLFRDKIIEVSTFRKSPAEDSKQFQSDGLLILRDNVYGEPRDDALRRDFTVNALFYEIEDQVVIDYTTGFADVSNRRLQTIGPPQIRLCEDPVRILRAIRFSCRLGLEVDAELRAAMHESVSELSKSAHPRVKEEIVRLLACGASCDALEMMFELGAFEVIFPELAEPLDRKATYFNSSLVGREFIKAVASRADRIDRGRRHYSDALFLAVLLSHKAGEIIFEALSGDAQVHDRAALIDEELRPVAMRMGISKRDLNRVKQIILAFPRFERKKWRGRPRPREFVRRDYFRETLEFYRLVSAALDRDPRIYNRWLERWEEWQAEEKSSNRSSGGQQSRRRRSRGGRRRRTPAAGSDTPPPPKKHSNGDSSE